MTGKPIEAIDHLLTHVHDLDAAATLFRRMGFTLSPVSHIEAMGISNHLVLMQPIGAGHANFIELMATSERSRLPPAMAGTLSGGEGLKSIVLATCDAAAAQQAMMRLGFEAAPPVHVRREWVIGPGRSVFPEFDVILPFPNDLTFNGCQYHNVELYLRPEWLDHRNGALGVRSVLALAADPTAAASRFAVLFNEPVNTGEGVAATHAGGVALEVFTLAAARRRFGIEIAAPASGAAWLGYRIEVRALDVLRSALREGDVPHREDDRTIYIDPTIGLGNLMAFTESDH